MKRLMREAQELSQPTAEYHAQPIEDNLFEWHFSVRGPPDSDFNGGVYHGRISLPPDYPMKPPSIMLLTPNGRFEVNRKICLSISGHHPESWRPSWSIRTALLAIIGFMPSPGMGAIASLDYTMEERQKLAKKSLDFHCEHCGRTADLLSHVGPTADDRNEAVQAEAREIATQVMMKVESTTVEPVRPKEDVTENEVEVTPSSAIPTVGEAVVEASSASSSEQLYGYIMAAIIVALAILLFRRLTMLSTAA